MKKKVFLAQQIKDDDERQKHEVLKRISRYSKPVTRFMSLIKKTKKDAGFDKDRS